jgi:hypothetical protein
MDPQEQQNQFGVLKLQSPPPLVDYPAESGFSFANPVYEPNVRRVLSYVSLTSIAQHTQEKSKIRIKLQKYSSKSKQFLLRDLNLLLFFTLKNIEQYEHIYSIFNSFIEIRFAWS